MMSSAETSEELMLNKPTSKSTTTTNRSQPIHFINANKKAVDTSSNSRAVMSSDHYHHVHHIYTAPHFQTTNSLLEYFYSTSYGQQQQHSSSYLSTSAGKIASNNTLNQAKSNGLYLNDLTNEFSNNRVSAFLPPEEIIINDQVGAKNEIVSRIFSEVQEVQEGKVDNVLRVMSFHPEFLQEFINLYNYLMYSQHGALPYDWRHYIAIMAAARHKCIYLVKQQEREFLNQNGQSAWLKHGIAHIPHKLKGLCELNKLLCHQPWLINHTHLEKILKGQFSWTVTELTMAITILTLFHSLSGFAFGCGINENYTQELSRQYEREEEENAAKRRAAKRRTSKKSSKKLSKQHDTAENSSSSNTTRSSRTVVMNKNGGSTSSSSGVIGCIDGVEDEFESESEDQQAPDDDDEENYGEEEDDVDEDDEDDEDEDEDYYEQDEDDQEYEEDGEEESRHSDRRLIDNDEHEDEDLETGVDGRFLPQAASVAAARHYGRSNRVKNYSSNAAASASSAATHSAANSASTGGRGRSNSTGASNRTLSNSSASSCELGIDMLLKEMQMIKAEDKQNQQQQQQQQTKTSDSSLSSSMLSSSCSGTTATTPSSSSSSSSLIMIQKQLAANRSNSPATQQCLSPASIGGNLPGSGAASSSGPSTITNNSPTAATVANNQSYSSSNDVSNRQQYQSASHDNNNNSIHHYNYHHHHHYNQPSNHHHQNHHQNHTYHNANNTVMNTNLSKDMNEIMRNEEVEKSDDENKSHNKMKFMESSSSSSSSNKGYHINHHTAPQQQQQQQPVSAHEAIVAQKIRDYMLKYAYDADYGYEDVEASGDPSLRLEYYTWENQGYITAQSVYPDICDFLDKNFQVAANMTYNTMGNVKGVDTSLFRKAVWFYTHSLYGVRHDDYDYNQIRALLKSPLRKYIKMVCTQPERITKSHYDSIMKEFAHSEKVHMNLVIMEARIQASMLYFLRAVNSYFG